MRHHFSEVPVASTKPGLEQRWKGLWQVEPSAHEFYLNSKITQSLGRVYVIDELQRVVCSPLQTALLGKVDLFVFYGLFCGEEKSIKPFTFAF